MKSGDLPEAVREWLENQEEPILLMVEKIAPNIWGVRFDSDPKMIKEIAKTYR